MVGVEICEDLWMPIPPSSVQAIAGANVLLNLSASNETIGKSRYRTDLVVGQSGRCIAAYAYAELGAVGIDDRPGLRRPLPDRRERPAAGASRAGSATAGRSAAGRTAITARRRRRRSCQSDRRVDDQLRRLPRSTWRPFRTIPFALSRGRWPAWSATVVGHAVRARARAPSCTAAAPRSSASSARGWPSGSSSSRPRTPLNIGISGGLDSTLALLVAVKTCDMLGIARGAVQRPDDARLRHDRADPDATRST